VRVTSTTLFGNSVVNGNGLGNTGALPRIDATFGGWKSAPDGGGNAIAAGATFAP